MEKEKLHRFFAGTTSIQEGMDIRAWMEASLMPELSASSANS